MNRPKKAQKKVIVPWGDHVLHGRNVGRTVGASKAQQRREEFLKQRRQQGNRPSHTSTLT